MIFCHQNEWFCIRKFVLSSSSSSNIFEMCSFRGYYAGYSE